VNETSSSNTTRILVSACLLGEPVRYDGAEVTCHNHTLDRWQKQGRLVAVCPEASGGLPVPRDPCELTGGDGDAFLDGRAKVVRVDGRDTSDEFLRGAQATLAAAQAAGARVAILKENSPSCGTRWTYDGTFSGQLMRGRGATAALLERNGIRTFSEFEIDRAARFLETLEPR
jgi:uncharacterized protein YbbK (DUF523 family)